MEELLELRRYIEQQRYPEALDLLAESAPRPHQRVLSLPEGGFIPWPTKAWSEGKLSNWKSRFLIPMGSHSVGQLEPGSPAAIRQVMHEPPHLRWEAVDELERAIATGKLPVHHAGVFDQRK